MPGILTTNIACSKLQLTVFGIVLLENKAAKQEGRTASQSSILWSPQLLFLSLPRGDPRTGHQRMTGCAEQGASATSPC